jgi:hypothetical protein
VVTKPYRLKPFSGRGFASTCFSLLHFYLELGSMKKVKKQTTFREDAGKALLDLGK